MNPTENEIRQAYYAWLHSSSRADIDGSYRAYFFNNWRALPGLKQHVDAQIAKRVALCEMDEIKPPASAQARPT